jgi:hypothetical protein
MKPAKQKPRTYIRGMERLEMVTRDIEDLDRAVRQALPASDRRLRIAAVGEPRRDVGDILGPETRARAQQDERWAEARRCVRDILPEHARVHGELFLDQRGDLRSRGARVEVNDGVDDRVREGDVVNRARGVDEEDPIDLDPATCQLKGNFICSDATKGPP